MGGGSCHEVTIVNFRFHESQNKKFTSDKFIKVTEKSDHNAVKFCYELNLRHSQFNSYLFTIHSQGVLHFTPHGIHFNHDSQNRFLSNHDSQSTKKPDHGVTKIPLPPSNKMTAMKKCIVFESHICEYQEKGNELYICIC